MLPNQNLVPNMTSKVALVVGALVLATIGLFERRTRVVLDDGTELAGIVEETATGYVVELPSGSKRTLDRARVVETDWFNVDVDLVLGLDLKGGTSLRYALDLSEVPEAERAEVLQRTIDTFGDRLDTLGVRELQIRPAGENEITIELPGVSMEESGAYEQVVQSLGRLEFRIVAESTPGVVNLQTERQRVEEHLATLPAGWQPKGVDLSQFDVQGPGGVTYRWYPYNEDAIEENPALRQFPFVLLEIDPAASFTGESIERTFPTLDGSGFPAVGFEMKANRAGAFGEFTGSHVGRQMAIVLDGQVSTAPVLQDRISNTGVINGGVNGFTQAEQRALLTVLNSGSLRVTPKQLSKATIGPTLGEASIRSGLLAGVFSAIAVIAFMLFYYRAAGVIACLVLLMGMYLLVGGLGFLEATLTLPGIAGILLTVGMAVDQNILINERIREEREKGKTLAQSVKNGFDRAFVTIVDAQATTFIAGAILYWKGTGPIKGFAVTLMLGIVTTMFAAIVGSKVLFAIGLAKQWLKTLSMQKLIGVPNVDFTRYLKPATIFSTVFIVAGLTLFGMNYRQLEGLDFAGGFQAHVKLAEPMPQPEVLARLAPHHETVKVVTMLDVAGDDAGAATKGARDFLITIPAEPDREGDEAVAENYLAELREVLGDLLVADGVADLAVTKDAEANRSQASFRLNFTAPVTQELVTNRLRDVMAVTAVEPVGGAAPAASYTVQATFPTLVEEAQVRAAAATALADLPGNVRLSEPVPSSQFIGGAVGKRLTNDAIIAIFLASIAILIYIRIRFHDIRWGLAACVACLHDVLVAMAAMAFFGLAGIVSIEMDLATIGAFMTLIGYSLNDTIVIFDRVRENLPRVDKPFREVVNLSINQTLSRTLLTALTTLLAVVILFAFNYGQRNVIEGFAFILLLGLIAGTYSTVFIASPMIVWMHNRQAAAAAVQRPGVPQQHAAS